MPDIRERFFCSKFSMKNSPKWLNGTRLDAKRSLFDVISVGTVIVRTNRCGEQGFVHNKAGSFTKILVNRLFGDTAAVGRNQ